MKRIGIDAHCHIFNASDLPAAKFTATVILKLEERLPSGLEHLAKWLTWFVVEQISKKAPDGKSEIKHLNNSSKAGAANLLKLRQLSAEQQFITDMQDGVNELLNSEDRDARELGIILSQELGDLTGAGSSEFVDLIEGADSLSAPFLPLARFSSRRGWFAYIKDFLWFLRQLRYDNAEKMFALYGGANRVNLIAPALIDYSFWLQKAKNSKDTMDTSTPLEDQIKVMEVVNRVSKGVIHAYAPYDPLRDVEQKGRSLKVVQDAIAKHGFVGVKVYPPMGFQAWGNESLDFWIPETNNVKWRKSLGRELDQRLRAFYEWCLEKDVPILTHSNSTVLSRSEYADRPSPKHWGHLLEHSGIPGIEKLRVLMGHFGGFGDEHPNPKNEKEKLESERIKEWTDEILRLCLKFDNIYADLSYHEIVLDDTARARYTRQLKAMVAGPGVGMKMKLCYGSDWVMLARQPDNEFYRDRMEEAIRNAGFGAAGVANVMGHNALRFLGLSPNLTGGQRLEKYYRTKSVSPPCWWESAKSTNLIES